MATQTVQAPPPAPTTKIKSAPIVCFIVTVLLAVLFVYPVYFAVISLNSGNIYRWKGIIIPAVK